MLLLTLFLGCGEPGYDYGANQSTVDSYKQLLDTSPCNVDTVRKLAQLMIESGDLTGASALATTKTTECDLGAGLLSINLEIARSQKDWTTALSVVDQLIAAEPKDDGHVLTRAEIQEQAGQKEEAIATLRGLYAAGPARALVPLERMAVLQEADHPCDALKSWQHLGRLVADRRPLAAEHIGKLDTLPQCAGVLPVNVDAQVKGKLVNSWVTFPVTLNGGATAWMGIDTGTPYTVLGPELTAQLFPTPPTGPQLTLATPAGDSTGTYVELESLMIDGKVELKQVDVVLVPSLPDGLQGVMGADLFTRVGFRKESDLGYRVASYAKGE